jgi:biotin operon repressor
MDDLRALIEQCVGDGGSVHDVADRVLKVLDDARLRVYSDEDRLPVLNAHGRVLVAVLEDPGVSQRALASYLGVYESAVNRSLRSLANDGVLVKERVNGKVVYRFDEVRGCSHPDIARFIGVLLPLFTERSSG